MRIYRVEMLNGSGPYHGDGSWINREYNAALHPLPIHDGIPCYDYLSNYRFGFESFDKFKAWFNCPIELSNLHNLGYCLSVYEIDKIQVAIGFKQVVFSLQYASLVNRIPLSEITHVIDSQVA